MKTVILYQVMTKTSGAKTVFESVTIDSALDDEYAGEKLSNIELTAYAIQAAGFDSADAAWTAYNTQNAQN